MNLDEYNRHLLMKFQEKILFALSDEDSAKAYSVLQSTLRDGVEFVDLSLRARTLETKESACMNLRSTEPQFNIEACGGR